MRTQAKAAYETAGARRFFLHVHPSAQSEAVDATCRELGLERTRGWQKFSRAPDASVPEAHSDLVIREIGQDEGEAFGRIICDAFDLGDAALPWIARLPGRGRKYRTSDFVQGRSFPSRLFTPQCPLLASRFIVERRHWKRLKYASGEGYLLKRQNSALLVTSGHHGSQVRTWSGDRFRAAI